MTLDLISIIIPTCNRCRILPRAIKSALNQRNVDVEIIVVSDGSTDDTEQVVKSFADPRIAFLSHPAPRGASAARNTGIAKARGQFLAFLDDDDEWEDDSLLELSKKLKQSPPNVGMVYGWLDYYRNGSVIKELKPQVRGNIFPEMLKGQAIGNSSSVLIRREVLTQIKGFDETMLRGNDGDFFRRISKHYAVEFIPKVVAKVYTDDENRISSNTKKYTEAAARSFERRLVVFDTDYQTYPEAKAVVLLNLAICYFKLRQIGKAFHTLGQALRFIDGPAGKYALIQGHFKRLAASVLRPAK